jgi:hypothetical protein
MGVYKEKLYFLADLKLRSRVSIISAETQKIKGGSMTQESGREIRLVR